MGKRGAGNREGDVVLIHYQDKPMAYARIEAIAPDVKKDWYQVTLLLLTIPSRTVTWILREAYIQGEIFTMSGQPVRIARVERHQSEDKNRDDAERQPTTLSPQPPVQKVKVLPFKKEK